MAQPVQAANSNFDSTEKGITKQLTKLRWFNFLSQYNKDGDKEDGDKVKGIFDFFFNKQVHVWS